MNEELLYTPVTKYTDRQTDRKRRLNIKVPFASFGYRT